MKEFAVLGRDGEIVTIIMAMNKFSVMELYKDARVIPVSEVRADVLRRYRSERES